MREIIRFGRASVNAFAEAEREANQLRSQLTGINLEFATPLVDEYIDKLELLTGRTGGELVTAFNNLSRATEDVSNAQNLLNLALDISAATGKDLASVSGALQRAYKGVFVGFTNEATFAANFSTEMGYLDNETLLTYQNFQISGMVIRKKSFVDFGMLKDSFKLTFGYEFLLRMTNNNVKVITIPRIGYKHPFVGVLF